MTFTDPNPSETEKPLPCPFCGSDASFLPPSGYNPAWEVRCNDCDIGFADRKRDKAIARWNKRGWIAADAIEKGEHQK